MARKTVYALIYDGGCQVCFRFVLKVQEWDRNRQIQLVDSRSPGITLRFAWISSSAMAEAMHLVRDDGVTWQGAAAVEELTRVLPRGRWISWLFHVPFARIIADKFYRWFARNRYRFGCGKHCRPGQALPTNIPPPR